jgi:hypothetical protein
VRARHNDERKELVRAKRTMVVGEIVGERVQRSFNVLCACPASCPPRV